MAEYLLAADKELSSMELLKVSDPLYISCIFCTYASPPYVRFVLCFVEYATSLNKAGRFNMIYAVSCYKRRCKPIPGRTSFFATDRATIGQPF